MGVDLKFALTAVLLTGTAIFLRIQHDSSVIPPRQTFSSLPRQLGAWRGTDSPISREVLDVLGPGDFLLRNYRDGAASDLDIDLFMAYFPTQTMGDTLHSPQHCLPGSGWFPVESSRIMLSLPGHKPFLANRYLVAKGDDRALVLYWYWSHDRAIASEYWAKLYLVADAIRLNRSDGALIRIITPLRRREAAVTAEERLVAFAGELVPLINTYAPR